MYSTTTDSGTFKVHDLHARSIFCEFDILKTSNGKDQMPQVRRINGRDIFFGGILGDWS
jgi:hypothetical protein